MHEIIEAESVSRLFIWLALGLPPIGLCLGALIGRLNGSLARWMVVGLLVGLLGPLNWLIWSGYNLITLRLGLDSVANVLINLLIFAMLGGIVGAALAVAMKRLFTDRSIPQGSDGSVDRSDGESQDR